MTRSKRIQPVLKVAETREREAARRVGESQLQLDQQRARLAELTAYRDEYARRFQSACSGGIDAAMFNDYRAFLTRLNQAIEHQRALIEAGEQAYADCRQRWLDVRRRSQALDKVAERYRRQEVKEENRKEQKESDERSQHLSHKGDGR
jgi:flagellar FliJ protein